jgi:hypothetical protein
MTLKNNEEYRANRRKDIRSNQRSPMKTLSIIAVLLFLSCAGPVFAQDQTSGQAPSSPASRQTAQSQTTDTYVFPSKDVRVKRYVRSVVGPFALLRVAGSSAIDQWDDTPAEWEQGAEGYGKRFASQLGRNAIRQSVQFGLSEALHLDSGFQRSKKKGFGPRLGDALIQNVTSRTRTGKRVLSMPILAGAYAAPVIAYETWYPDRHTYKDGLRSGTYSLATGFAINVFREFIFNW